MRFLADESCDFAVVRALRAGHDVLAVCEVAQRSADAELILQAAQEERILLTVDKDFGWLVFVGHSGSDGVVLIRFPGGARQALARAILELVGKHGDALSRSFAVLQPGHVRISPKPEAPQWS